MPTYFAVAQHGARLAYAVATKDCAIISRHATLDEAETEAARLNNDAPTTNAVRAARGASAVGQYGMQHDEAANDQERLIDLLADLMHLCRTQAEAEDCPMNFDDALAAATSHFNEEVNDEQA